MEYTIKRVEEILKTEDYSLVNELEDIIVEKLLEKETSSMIICGCRNLIRNAFFLTIISRKIDSSEDAVYRFCKIILNHKNQGAFACRLSVQTKIFNDITTRKLEEVYKYFCDEYYNNYNSRGRNEEFRYCKPVRYFCDKMLDSKLTEEKLISFEMIEQKIKQEEETERTEFTQKNKEQDNNNTELIKNIEILDEDEEIYDIDMIGDFDIEDMLS